MTSTEGQIMGQQACYSVLRKYWEPRVADNVRQIRGIAGGVGVVFDIYEDKFTRFIENYEYLKSA